LMVVVLLMLVVLVVLVVRRRIRRGVHDTLGECRFDLLLVGALREEWDEK
jgi:hypothetical protein